MFAIFFYTIIAINCVAPTKLSKRPFEFEINKFTWHKFDVLVKQFECSIVKLANSKYNTGLMFELSKEMPRNLNLGLVICVKPQKGRKFIKFMDTKVNVCNLLEHVMAVPIMKYIMEKVTRNSNIPISCPLRGNYIYNITNVEISSEIFPPYTPVTEFNFTLNLLDTKKIYATYTIEGETKRIS
ncbi:uncharacterized protein LOC106081722 isoform X1 [Stomoxys calcitrans]|uniref:uncharacterized protein LOC106081722 isoform X1 n=1 Tax=Stomoxys calcitrans TaxID=35570 RepID=UPI0027E39CD8|nr:uncharacterized protein LOC106081722 isoform X1 [Stomoxys calcitrans]